LRFPSSGGAEAGRLSTRYEDRPRRSFRHSGAHWKSTSQPTKDFLIFSEIFEVVFLKIFGTDATSSY
jgi:hypothetical protein